MRATHSASADHSGRRRNRRTRAAGQRQSLPSRTVRCGCRACRGRRLVVPASGTTTFAVGTGGCWRGRGAHRRLHHRRLDRGRHGGGRLRRLGGDLAHRLVVLLGELLLLGAGVAVRMPFCTSYQSRVSWQKVRRSVAQLLHVLDADLGGVGRQELHRAGAHLGDLGIDVERRRLRVGLLPVGEQVGGARAIVGDQLLDLVLRERAGRGPRRAPRSAARRRSESAPRTAPCR